MRSSASSPRLWPPGRRSRCCPLGHRVVGSPRSRHARIGAVRSRSNGSDRRRGRLPTTSNASTPSLASRHDRGLDITATCTGSRPTTARISVLRWAGPAAVLTAALSASASSAVSSRLATPRTPSVEQSSHANDLSHHPRPQIPRLALRNVPPETQHRLRERCGGAACRR